LLKDIDISVVLPVYNGGEKLSLSIDSVLRQTYPNFELLIIDDCSPDNSWSMISAIKDERVCIYKNDENKGLFYNLNFLIKQSKGRLIKLWAQDDIMYPNCLSSFVQFHSDNPEIGFSYSGRDMIDENGNIKPNETEDKTPAIISSELHAKIAFFTGSIAGNIANVCINKEALLKVGYFNEQMKISADFDMWVRLAKEYKTGFINEKLIQLRDHENQLSRRDEYYIYHVKEDRQVYQNLFSYCSPALKKTGKKMLRRYKLNFYYTLMLQAFLKGKIKLGIQFLKELQAFDNFFVLSYFFILSRIKKRAIPATLFE